MVPDTQNLSAFIREASQALHAAYDNLPDRRYDVQVQNHVTALVNRLQQAYAQALTDARDKSIPLKNVASIYAFEILCQECTTVDSETRFTQFLPIFLDAFDGLAEFAYSRRGQINLLNHTRSIERSTSSITPSRVLHKTSAFGVLLGGEGTLQPVLSGSAAVQELAIRLHNLGLRAEGENCICLDDLIIHVTHHLIEFFESRSGFVSGVPHGIIGGVRDTPARDLQELFRFVHSGNSWYSSHLARAHLLKLAKYLFKLFAGMGESTESGFTQTREDIEVCSRECYVLCTAFCIVTFLVTPLQRIISSASRAMTEKFYYRYDDDDDEDESDGDSDEDDSDEDPGSIPPRTPPTVSKADAVLRDPDCPVPKRQRSLEF